MTDPGNHTNAQHQDSQEQKKSLKRSWKSSGPVAKLTVVFAGIAALSTTIYAIVAGGQLLVMRGQLDEMSAAKRPWIGPIGELKMLRPPSFEVNDTPRGSKELIKKYPSLAEPLISIEVHASWSIQNFGASPARRVMDETLLHASDDANSPPDEVRNLTCKVGEQMGQNQNISATAIFPGGVISIPDRQSTTFLPAGTKAILGLWLVQCITYQDTLGKIHHTKVLWASDLSHSPQPEFAVEKPPLQWTPFTKFRLVDSDVD